MPRLHSLTHNYDMTFEFPLERFKGHEIFAHKGVEPGSNFVHVQLACTCMYSNSCSVQPDADGNSSSTGF